MPVVGGGASGWAVCWSARRAGPELSGGSGLTPRSADAAAPRANVGGFSAKNHAPTVAVDGDAAPLTPSLGVEVEIA